MLLVDWIIGSWALLLMIPTTVLAAEVLGALLLRKPLEPGRCPNRPRFAILIPAHDETSNIGRTVQDLLPQLRSTDRLVVVADNCSDDTAAVAAEAGAEVLVRTDQSRRGKGFALDFGIRHLEQDPPEVVIIIDADCRTADSSLDQLAHICLATCRPVQSLYLIYAPTGSSPMLRITEFAVLLKNLVRPLGLHKMNLPCQLMGTGMAFPWPIIRAARLATGHIVEDLKLGLELAASGSPPIFCPEIRVTSPLSSSAEGVRSQRTRWEHGYLGVIAKDMPHVIRQSIVTKNSRLLAMGMDLCVPPVALLCILSAMTWTLSALLLHFTGKPFPFAVSTASLALLLLSVLLTWYGFGQGIISLTDLALAAIYAAKKVPLYIRFFSSRQAEWVRTKRD